MKHRDISVVGFGFAIAGLLFAPAAFGSKHRGGREAGVSALLGAGLALLSRSKAKKANEAPSMMTAVTLATATLGVLTNSLHERVQAKVAAQQATLAPKLLAAELDEATACEVAKLHLGEVMGELSSEDARCTGFTQGAVARIRTEVGPSNGPLRITHFCLAKANRWFVLSTPESERCPSAGPAAPPTVPTDEAGYRAQEDQLRADEKAALVESFDLALMRAHDAVIDWLEARGALEETNEGKLQSAPCAAAVPLGGMVASVDVDALPGSTKKGWPILSSYDVESALEAAPVATRAKAIENLQSRGPVLAVFASTLDKRLPGAGRYSGHFKGGMFTGWLLLWHMDEGRVLCGVPVHFESSRMVVPPMKSKLESTLTGTGPQDAVDQDFHRQFWNAARRAADEVSGMRLKLEYRSWR